MVKVPRLAVLFVFFVTFLFIIPEVPVNVNSASFLTKAQSVTATYLTHWWAGSIWPSSSASQYASSVCGSIQIPSSNGLSHQKYGVVISAWDSNGSYDQIGFGNDFGEPWGLVYSWSVSSAAYYTQWQQMVLSYGATYTFNITVRNGTVFFLAYNQSSTLVFNQTRNTGGNYLILGNAYQGYKSYTTYEEVWYTQEPGGYPVFNFCFYNQYWVSYTDGSTNTATWTNFTRADPDYNAIVPSNVKVVVDDDSVLIWNTGTSSGPSTPTLYGPQTVFKNTWYTYTTDSVSDAGGVPIRYHLRVWPGGCGGGTYENTTIWVSSGTPMSWNLLWGSGYCPQTLVFRARAEDAYGIIGGWSAFLMVSLNVRLSISASDGGSTSPTPGTYLYDTVTNVTVTAIPFDNYGFDHWQLGSSTGWDNPINVSMADDCLLTAYFHPVTDVAVTSVLPLKTAVGQGCCMNVSVTVANLGGWNETFEVSAFANSTFFESQFPALVAGSSANLTFTWNSTVYPLPPYGNCDISVHVWFLPNEENYTNNDCDGGMVAFTIPGDIIGQNSTFPDYSVKNRDLNTLLISYGSPDNPAKPWNPNADIDNNGHIDAQDLNILLAHYGQHYP